MTELAAPSLDLYESWAETIAEFGNQLPNGSGFWHVPVEFHRATTREACQVWIDAVSGMDDPMNVPEGLVPSDYRWITDAGAVVGFIAVRHHLNDSLLEEGGHIGYSIRPSARRQGHATRALGLALRRARELGVERALVTCNIDNVASARTIEHNGGVLEDVRGRLRRYWIPT